MLWLIYCGLFVLMLISIFRMLQQRGKWAWCLFLGMIASVGLYVGLFLVPVLSLPALQNRHALMACIAIAGTLLYAAGMVLFIRSMSRKLQNPPGKS